LGVTEFQIFKGALWSLRGNAWNLSEERQEQRKNLCRQYTKLGRAMSLRESLQAIYASPERQVAEAELDWWYGWAARSRLSPSANWPRPFGSIGMES
jgi:transposase